MNRFKYKFFLGPILLLAMISLTNFQPLPKLLNKIAPEFQRRDMNGNLVSLNEYQGKVIVLNFWATWNAPSLKEMGYLERISQKYARDHVQIIGVAVVSNEKEIADRLDMTGVTYPILIGNKALISAYGNFSALPCTFIINREGKIKSVLPGSHSYLQLEQVVREVVKSDTIQSTTKMAVE